MKLPTDSEALNKQNTPPINMIGLIPG